jgi:hypothetical protein
VVAWAAVARYTFRVITGSLRSVVSSPPVVRQFCEQCGTPITYANEGWPDSIDVTITTLDTPGALQPTVHIWMEDAVSWDRPNDGLPQFARSRPEPAPLS